MLLLKLYRAALILLLIPCYILTAVSANILFFFDKGIRAIVKTKANMWFAGLLCGILGIRVRKSGGSGIDNHRFSVCNHISYLDILILGSVRPSVFLSKQDVKQWPLIGMIIVMTGTLFIRRESLRDTVCAMEAMEEKINYGLNMVVFPEGTTSDGSRIREFKSALFNLPAEKNLAVVPISIRYTGINGTPASSDNLDEVAWYGDMEFLPHLWNVLGLKSIEAALRFSQPIISSSEGGKPVNERKLLCALAYKRVHEGFNACSYNN
jgi:lyso-ornithine lipid O-acyltransferase